MPWDLGWQGLPRRAHTQGTCSPRVLPGWPLSPRDVRKVPLLPHCQEALASSTSCPPPPGQEQKTLMSSSCTTSCTLRSPPERGQVPADMIDHKNRLLTIKDTGGTQRLAAWLNECMNKNYSNASSGPWNILVEQIQLFIIFKYTDNQIKLSVTQETLRDS